MMKIGANSDYQANGEIASLKDVCRSARERRIVGVTTLFAPAIPTQQIRR